MSDRRDFLAAMGVSAAMRMIEAAAIADETGFHHVGMRGLDFYRSRRMTPLLFLLT
jgi:hypothetical protein